MIFVLARSNDMISTRCFIFFVVFNPIVQNGNCDNSSESFFDESVNLMKNVSSDGTTMEIHYTTCKITTEKLSADAQAKYTRVRTEGCNAKMIEARLERFERLLNEHLNEIRGEIVRSGTKEGFNYIETNVERTKVDRMLAQRNHVTKNVIVMDENEFNHGKGRSERSALRQDEIKLFNDTVHEEGRRKVYSYYWRVSGIHEKLLQWDTGRSERSPSFYVANAGYAMYLKFTPKYFPDGTIFISVVLTAGKNDSKIVWPFSLPVRIEILDLTRRAHDGAMDRSSRLWDPVTVCSPVFWERPRQRITGGSSDNPECVGLSISRQFLTTPSDPKTNFFFFASSPALFVGKYLANDFLLVKLNVHL